MNLLDNSNLITNYKLHIIDIWLKNIDFFGLEKFKVLKWTRQIDIVVVEINLWIIRRESVFSWFCNIEKDTYWIEVVKKKNGATQTPLYMYVCMYIIYEY